MVLFHYFERGCIRDFRVLLDIETVHDAHRYRLIRHDGKVTTYSFSPSPNVYSSNLLGAFMTRDYNVRCRYRYSRGKRRSESRIIIYALIRLMASGARRIDRL